MGFDSKEFRDHSGAREDIPDALLSPKPGITRAFFRAIDHLETLVDSTARLFRLIGALEKSPDLAHLGGLSLPSADERDQVRKFRNRISHGDDDIRDGKAGKGLATATLRPDSVGIELQHQRLEYADLARMLEQVHDYLRAAFEKR